MSFDIEEDCNAEEETQGGRDCREAAPSREISQSPGLRSE